MSTTNGLNNDEDSSETSKAPASEDHNMMSKAASSNKESGAHFEPKGNARKEHACKYALCNKTFTRKTSLRRHERTHSKQDPFYCPKCNQRFEDRYGLVIHQRNFRRLYSNFQCTSCNKVFREEEALLRHNFTACEKYLKRFMKRGY